MAALPGLLLLFLSAAVVVTALAPAQAPLRVHGHDGSSDTTIGVKLFAELEELSRIVDIAYCVGTAGLGITKPFKCASRCSEFPSFELVRTWNTGPLLSDSCGYLALSHPPSPRRIILAFRGTYSIANTIVDLSTIPQEYVPYPGDDDDHDDDSPQSNFNGRARANDEELPPAHPPKCTNCTVHTGFYTSWLNTRNAILPDVAALIEKHPDYQLTLVGHSLGGAVAALAALDFKARGWDPHVTTFGEPRMGNRNLAFYMDARFNTSHSSGRKSTGSSFHRVTHAGDPVPLLPLAEWGYAMHAQEIFIAAPELPPSVADVHFCDGDEDPACIAAGETGGGWGIPARFKFWELFWAHRDYFWRLGLCVPGNGRGGYSRPDELGWAY